MPSFGLGPESVAPDSFFVTPGVMSARGAMLAAFLSLSEFSPPPMIARTFASANVLPQFLPINPSIMQAATSASAAAFYTGAFTPQVIQAATSMIASFLSEGMSVEAMIAATSVEAVFISQSTVSPSIAQAATGAFAEVAPLFIIPGTMTARTTATGGVVFNTLVVSPTDMQASTGLSFELSLSQIAFLKDLWRANLPQEVVIGLRHPKIQRVNQAIELDKVRERRPDKLPTLDHW